MKLNLMELALETTRRCNLTCPGYCMRGESQNIDLTTDIIDTIFDNNEIGFIYKICFSGGEPTLNPEIIIYTINKIIENNIKVGEIAMVTNGQIYRPEITMAFNKFNEYKNAKLNKELREEFAGLDEKIINDSIKVNTDNHVRITFSTDQFHHPIKQEVKEAYYRDAKGLKITETGEKKEEDIQKSGFSTVGKEVNYQGPLRIMPDEKNSILLVETIYVTANGYYIIGGDGAYICMDKMNCGHVNDVTIHDVVNNYGTTKDNKTKEILAQWKNQNSSNETKKLL